MRARWFGLLLAVFALPLCAEVTDLPEPLMGWESWVLHDEPYRQCPFFATVEPSDESSYACALPGTLGVQIADGAAQLSVDFHVYAPGYVDLPSAQDAFPEGLSVDGTAAVVLTGDAGPRVWLESGTHALRYTLDLAAAPDSLDVPTAFRVIELAIGGRSVFPLAREGSTLWLERKVDATESDALEITVHRLWTDAIPQRLSTRIQLHVAGKAREIRLGPAWPESHELTSVSGELAAVVEPGRVLKLQATAGSYLLNIETRALENAPTLNFEFPEGWPDHEVWSFQADHRLRVVDVAGTNPIDPAQGEVPSEWAALPAFAIASGEGLTISERTRGLGDDANRVQLSRELWLDFDGAGYTVQDHISGRMRRGFRLDLNPPYVLLSASERSEPLLVTAGAQPDVRGFEVRYPTLNVDTSARLPRAGSFPAHGWSERLDGMSAAVHLPPGFRLLYASGVDRAPAAWIERWNIYAVFIAAFAVVLAWRLGGYGLAGAVAVFAVLSAHEADAPHYSLIALLLFALAWRSLNAGRLRRLLAGAAIVCALIFAWNALPFVLQQARFALHPQLALAGDGRQADYQYYSPMDMDMGAVNAPMVAQEAAPMPMAPPAPPPPPRGGENAMQKQSMDMVQAGVTRAKRASVMERYAKDAVVQAGIGRPTWQWVRADLIFDGPVDTAQTMNLWLSPPLTTALWRLAILLALGAIAVALARLLSWPPRRTPAAVVALALLLFVPSLNAAEIPDAEMLEALKQRLIEAPECAPGCGRLAQATLSLEDGRLRLEVDAHAAERILLPLPLDDAALSEVRITVDGKDAGLYGTDSAPTAAWIAVERGVHRVALTARVHGDRVALDFPLAPVRLELSVPGWNATGLRDGRLLAERLELVRDAPSVESAAGTQARVPVKPYVRVERELALDLDWTVVTRVVRIAPLEGGYSVRIPLLPGEQPTDPTLRVTAGVAEVSLQPGQSTIEIVSRLPRSETITLTAPALTDRSEVWRVVVGPSLSMQASGVPVSEPASGIDEDDVWQHEFNPLPGETLVLTISRPAAVPGATLVADSVALVTQVGARSRTQTLTMGLRATQGGNHSLTLPAGAELLDFNIDGRSLSLKLDAGVLTFPIKPGTQGLNLSWREDLGASTVTRTPALDLGLDAANIQLRIDLPADRWILHVTGPAVGPAVLYWSALLALLAIAWGLGRSGRALLSMRDWMLLVLGFSTLSAVPFFIVAVTFIALDARRRHPPAQLRPFAFDLLQLVLTGAMVLAFSALVATIPAGLLGSPDMQIEGGYGGYGQLAWLADRSAGALPEALVVSLPMWVYKALMLAFALWLANALVRWIKLAWNALIVGGGWKRLRKERVAAAAAPEPVVVVVGPPAE
jgi:hypothetical protein